MTATITYTDGLTLPVSSVSTLIQLFWGACQGCWGHDG